MIYTVINSPNYSPANRGPEDITHIIIQTPFNTGSSAIKWFRDSRSRMSPHYFVDKKGRIFQLVEDRRVAWHTKACNSFSLGIMLEDGSFGDADPKTGKWKLLTCVNNPSWWTDSQLKAAAKLIASLMVKYGIPLEAVVGYDSKFCQRFGGDVRTPGRFFPWLKFRFLIQRFLDKQSG